MPLLNLTDAPTDPLERVLWLSGVKEQALKELNAEFASAYYDVRLQGQFHDAVALKIHSKKTILAFTRHENNATGRMVRWNDSLDPTSSAYSG